MSTSAKKRKRAADDGINLPNKKPVVSIPNVEDVAVSFVQSNGSWAPILVSTPGFDISNELSLHPYYRRRKPTSSAGGLCSSIESADLLVHSSDHLKLDYTGVDEQGGSDCSLLKHYVGVFDPATGDLEVVESRKLVLRGVVRAHQAAQDALQERITTTNLRELRNDLGEAFGTKKAKKAIASLTENAISAVKAARTSSPSGSQPKVDSATKALLDSMVDATKDMATREELQAVVDSSKPRPSANTEAQHIKDVYTAESVVGADTMKAIPVKEWQDTLKASKVVVVPSRYVANRLKGVAADVQRLKLCRYLAALVQFYSSARPRRSNRALPKADELKSQMSFVPLPILDSIKRKFSSQGEITKFQVDLIVTHMCAIALIIDNYEVDMLDLREDLKMEAKELQQYFHEIGARVAPISMVDGKKLGLDKAAMAQRKIAKLKLPLDFPKAKFGRRN